MITGDMPDRIGHRHLGEAESQGDADKTNSQFRIGGGNDCDAQRAADKRAERCAGPTCCYAAENRKVDSCVASPRIRTMRTISEHFVIFASRCFKYWRSSNWSNVAPPRLEVPP